MRGWIGQDGERRKLYSATMIDGIKRNSTIYMGDYIVRKADSILSKGGDVVVCLPGARIEHTTERERDRERERESRADHGRRKWRVHNGTHRNEQRRQGRSNCDS